MVCLAFLILAQALAAVGPRAASRQKKSTEDDPVRLNATLVQVPVIVTDHGGKFITDLSQTDFTVSEDGKRQDVSLFAAVKQPFSAVLVLDTSNSAQDRLKAIQNEAVNFRVSSDRAIK
jgi:VWFA-related protein